MNKRHLLLSVFAVSASLGLGFAPPADAADFGGNCCADLEERIAELEATTARKGNRKVSLTISGYINEAVMFWDDGQESNAYVVTNDSGRTRVRFRGAAKINSDWEAGYRLELGFRSARSDRVDQGGFDSLGGALRGNQPGSAIDVRYSEWYLKSKTFGEVHVGYTETASQDATEANVSQTASIAKNSDPEDHIAGFRLRAKGVNGAASLSGLEWRRLIKDDGSQAGDGARGQTVHYLTPSVAGFQLHASWGNDDFWDVGLKLKGDYGDFSVKGALSYARMTNANGGPLNCIETRGPVRDAECQQLGGSLSAKHKPTGVFFAFGAGWYEDEQINAQGQDGESHFYAAQAGIEQNWTGLGLTTLYGEYFTHTTGFNDRTVAAGDAINSFAGASNIFESDVDVIGGGIIQGIDAAAMRVYVVYRHFEADVRLTNGVTIQNSNALEDVDVFVAGGLIEF
jgi:hypothetical protein